MRSPVALSLAAGLLLMAAPALDAQTQCRYVPFSHANQFGNSNNVIPFTWTPTNYQQVFNASNFNAPFVCQSLGLRQDQQFGNRTGGTVDIEVNFGSTSFTAATLTTNFANNFNMGPKVNVFPRNMTFTLPNSGPPPTNPSTVLFTIPFTTPAPVLPMNNLLVEVLQRGNSRGNAIFTYPLDAVSNETTTTRLWGPGTTGTLGRNFGLLMCLGGGGGGGCTTNAAYATYGAGCRGTGAPGPQCNWVPSALANAFGNSNNVIPFTWTPINYQQVFDGSNLPTAFVCNGLGLRQDQQFGNRTGGTVDIEINLGNTTFNAATLTNTFATNFTSGKTNVVPRNMAFALPNSGPPPTNPNTVLFTVPFTTPFPVVPNMNLLVEVLQRGNSRGNAIFTYPLDADRSNTTQTRLFGTGATGSLGRNFGLIMCLSQPGGMGAVPTLTNTGLPRLGGSYTADLAKALANTPALLLTGRTQSSIDLTGVGGPGCTLLTTNFLAVQVVSTNAGGAASITQGVPNDQNLCGAHIYEQYFVFDPMANALQFVGTNGGDGTLGG